MKYGILLNELRSIHFKRRSRERKKKFAHRLTNSNVSSLGNAVKKIFRELVFKTKKLVPT